MQNILKRWGATSAVIILLIFFYLVQAGRFSAWLVDDAGISFAYARNLGQGQGLVAQPGAVPGEGFSNPSWVFLLSFFHWIGVDLVSMVKGLSLALSSMAIGVLFLSGQKLGLSVLLSGTAVGWMVCQPGFIIWSTSGLENPLYAALLALLLWLTLEPQTTRRAVVAGLVAGLVAITRPEGILYGALYLIFHLRRFKAYLPGLIMIYGGYMIFRLAYFGDLFPIPYYKKVDGLFGLPGLSTLLAKFNSLLLGLFGDKYLAAIVMGLLVFAVAFLLWKKAVRHELMVIGAFALVGLAGYLLLPKDWMEEYRYATPVFLFAYLLLAGILLAVANQARQQSLLRRAAVIALALWAAGTSFVFYQPRLDKFAKAPTISFGEVGATFQRFENYSRALGLERSVSVLTPDVGGALYYFPQVRILDLGGLVDSTIARTIDRDNAALWNYVFGKQPDFLDLHGGWEYAARLDSDPRFRALYTPIFEYTTPALREKYGFSAAAGDFVRKDLLASPNDLAKLQQLSPSWR